MLGTLIQKKENLSNNEEQSLIVSSFFMPNNPFYQSFFTIQYTIENKI